MASASDIETLINLDNDTVRALVKARLLMQNPRLKGSNAVVAMWQTYYRLEASVAGRQTRVFQAATQARLLAYSIPGYALYDGLKNLFGLGRVPGLGRATGLGIAPVAIAVIAGAGALAGALVTYLVLRPTDIPEARAARAEANALSNKSIAELVQNGIITPEEGQRRQAEMNTALDNLEQAAFNAGRDSRSGIWDAIKWGGMGLATFLIIRQFNKPKRAPAQ